MIVKKKKSKKIRIDLTGPEGNAFVLLGIASKWAKELKLDAEKISKEMKSGDYENLIKIFDKYFGSFCILER